MQPCSWPHQGWERKVYFPFFHLISDSACSSFPISSAEDEASSESPAPPGGRESLPLPLCPLVTASSSGAQSSPAASGGDFAGPDPGLGF